MKKFFRPLFILICIFILNGFASTTEAQLEKLHFNKILGSWDAKGISRNTDGSWKTDTTQSTWIWYEILNGEAIQDDWYANVSFENIKEAPSSGTNIRIYNEDEKKWHMAWIDTNNRKLQTFTAIEDSNSVIMEGKNAQGRDIKIVFYDIAKDRFSWKQEWTFDGGNTWMTVSKIECYRIE